MDVRWLKPLLGRPAPFTTIHLDATRAEAAGESEAADRWRAVRRTLERAGAAAHVLDEIGERVAVPTGVKGPHGRVLVADADGVVIDRVILATPGETVATFGPVPALLPAVRAADETVSQLLVEVDRSGADFTYRTGEPRAAADRSESVDGGHDDIHKTREGGLSRRAQTRAEDSWHRNAEVVAALLDRRVAEHTPELVLLTGDVRAVAIVADRVGQQTRELLVEVAGGGRGEGVNRDAFSAQVAKEVAAFRERRRAAVVERFRELKGRGDGAVTALDDVVEVLRRGQVAEVLLDDAAVVGSLRDRVLFVGPGPLDVAVSESELAALGIQEIRSLPAGAALLRAALGQDAGVTLASSADLVDGIGALLRWRDGSTPSEQLLTQSGDVKRVRAH